MRTVMLEKLAEINKKQGFLQESIVVENVLKEDITCKQAKQYLKKVCDQCCEDEDDECQECKCLCELAMALLDCCCKDEDKIPTAVKTKLSALLVCCEIDVEKVKTESVVETRKINNKYFGQWKEKLDKYN